MRRELVCHAVLFDVDGVLVDSRAIVERTWARWADRVGIHRSDLARIAHGRRTIDTIRDVAPQLDAESEAAWLEAVETSDVEGLVALPGAAAALGAVPDSRRAVVTSGGRTLATSRLTATGLPIPSVMVTAEQIPNGKPAPDAYLLAAQRLNIDPRACVVIEDTPPGIAAGRAAGATTIAVTTTFARSSLIDANLIVETLADLTIVPHPSGVRILATDGPP